MRSGRSTKSSITVEGRNGARPRPQLPHQGKEEANNEPMTSRLGSLLDFFA